MSDELIKRYERQLDELQRTVAGKEKEIKDLRRERRTYKEQLDAVQAEAQAKVDELLSQYDQEFNAWEEEKAALAAERDEFKTKLESAPGEQAQKLAEMETALRARDHRDAWTKAINGELHEKANVEKLWREIGYTPEGDAPDEATLGERIKEARDAAPYLFVARDAPGTGAAPNTNGASQGGARPKLSVSAEGPPGRGGRVSSGETTYRLSEIAVPGWEKARPDLREALANSTAVLLPE